MAGIPIKLTPQIDMADLQLLKEELVAALTARSGVIVEADALERVSTPVIQLLLAAARAFTADEQSFTLKAPSPVLTAAFDDLGLGEQFRSWSVE